MESLIGAGGGSDAALELTLAIALFDKRLTCLACLYNHMKKMSVSQKLISKIIVSVLKS
jgi:hypothetical protein